MQGLQPWSWLVAPTLLAVVATVVLGTPVRLFGLPLPEPVFPMVLAFAWPVIRPSVLGPFLLLLSGLFLDLFWGGALGLWALALLLVYAVALTARPLMQGQSPTVLAVWWLGAGGLAFGAAYLFAMLDAHVPPDPVAVGLQFAITVALFPLARGLVERFEDADVRFR